MKKTLLSTFWVLLSVVICAIFASYEQDSITPSKHFPCYLAILMPVFSLLLLLLTRKKVRCKNVKCFKAGPVDVELAGSSSSRNVKRRWLLLVFVALCGVTAFDLWWLGFPAASALGFVFFLVWYINKDLSELACTIISGCIAGLLVGICAMTQVRELDSDQLTNTAKNYAESQGREFPSVERCITADDSAFIYPLFKSIRSDDFVLTKETHEKFQSLKVKCPAEFVGVTSVMEQSAKNANVFFDELLTSVRGGGVFLSDEVRKGLFSETHRALIQETLDMGYLIFDNLFFVINDTNDVLKLRDERNQYYNRILSLMESLMDSNLVIEKTDEMVMTERQTAESLRQERKKQERKRGCFSTKDSVAIATIIDGIFEKDYGVTKERHAFFQKKMKDCPEMMGSSKHLYTNWQSKAWQLLLFDRDMIASLARDSVYVSDERKKALPLELIATQNESIRKHLKRDTIYPKKPGKEPYVPDSAHAEEWRKGHIKVNKRVLMRIDSLFDENLYK